MSAAKRQARRGSVLLAVTLILGIVAAVAFAMTRDTSFGSVAASAVAQGDEARYVAEAGLRHALWRADRNSCTGYDLPSTPFGSHAYAASFAPAAGSPVAVSVTATLASGATHSLTGKAARVFEAPLSIALQPGADEAKDAFLYEWKPDWNYGSANRLDAGDNGWQSKWRGLLRFDLGSVPVKSRVISATLELYQITGSFNGGPIGVRRLTTDWVEGTNFASSGSGATWDEKAPGEPWGTPGGDLDATSFGSTNVAPQVGWFSWDVTALVAGWVAGTYPNQGLALVHDQAMAQGRFASSDEADTTQHPRLSVVYSCECGIVCQAPQGTGNLLFVVADATNPDPEDETIQAFFESWGYTVTRIGHAQPQADFDALFSSQAAVYISATVGPGSIGTKLTNAPIGVVSEEGNLNDELQIASGDAYPTGTELNVLDDTHEITQLFSTGPLVLKTANVELLTDSGAPAPGAQVLAEVGGEGALLALETGAQLTSGAPAPARRVMLPLGDDAYANWAYLNNNGHLLVQRAIEWAMGSGALACETYRDDFDADSFSNEDGSMSWLEAWHEDDPAGAGPTSGNVQVGGGVLRLDDNPDTGGVPNLARPADLSSFATATLSFDFALGAGVEPIEDVAVVYVSGNGGFGWTELEDFSALSGGASGSRSYDISSHLAPDTMVRLAVTQAYGGPNEYFEVDNLEISACQGPGKLLLVVGDATTLSSKDVGRKALIESWGYNVTLIDDGESQADFDAAAAAVDVVYVSGTIGGGTLAHKLTGSPTPIVNEFPGKLDNFGFSSSTTQTFSGDTFYKSDAAHYITSPFGGSSILALTTFLSMPVPGGTLAPDLRVPADFTASEPAVVTLEAGAQRWDGNPAPARRVHLPFAPAETTQLTADAEAIVLRAIQWAGGAGGGATGPIAHWKLDDGTGNTAVDSEGGHDGTLSGGTWVAGKLGDALDLNGSTEFVTVPDAPELSPVDEFTLSAWIKSESLSGYDLVISKSVTTVPPGGSVEGYWLGTLDDEISFGFHNGAWQEFNTASLNLATDTWYHIAATFHDADDAVRVYLSGAEVLSQTTTEVPQATIGDLLLGKSTFGEYWNGLMDDVRIYDRALSPAEIAALAAPPVYRDEFNGRDCSAADYAGSDGGLDWSGQAWTESGESDGSCAGLVQVAEDPGVPDPGSYRLVLDERNREVIREADLSGFASATLSFVYRRYNYPTTSDKFTVSVSRDGAIWTPLEEFQGAASDPDYLTASYDISPYIGSGTRISFATTGINTIQTLYIDDVQIGEGGGGGGPGPGGCDDTYADDFETDDYTGSTGSAAWSMDWDEVNENGNANNGDEQVRTQTGGNHVVRVQDNDSGGEGVERGADLSAVTSATLSFLYWRGGLDDENDYVTVEVSDDGGDSWSVLDTITGPGDDPDGSPQSASHDISGFVAPDTRIRFVTSPDMGTNDYVYFDDVEIAVSGCAGGG